MSSLGLCGIKCWLCRSLVCSHRWQHPLSLLLLSDESEHHDSEDQSVHSYGSQLNHQRRVCLCACLLICIGVESVWVFSFSGICWNQTLCSTVCMPVTTEEKPPTRLIATSLIKSGENIKDGYKPETQASTPHLLNLLWFNFFFFSSIVCFSDYVEELGHPYMWVQNLGGLQFPVGASEVGVYPYCHPIGAQILTLIGIILAHSCSFPECL